MVGAVYEQNAHIIDKKIAKQSKDIAGSWKNLGPRTCMLLQLTPYQSVKARRAGSWEKWRLLWLQRTTCWAGRNSI